MRNLAQKTNGKFVNFYNRRTVVIPKQTDEYKNFLETLADRKEPTIFIHHHHGYNGLKKVDTWINAAKEKILSNKENKFYFFTTVREVLPFIDSRINYRRTECRVKIAFNDAHTDACNHNYQCKYLLYNHVANWRKK